MTLLEVFLNSQTPSLKICGITTAADAHELVQQAVSALGANFWPQSKRHLPPGDAGFLKDLAGKILRIGVFVNAPPELPISLYNSGLIDVIQLHGDETPEDAAPFREAGIPFIKAIGVKTVADLARAAEYGANAILLDAHAPSEYGGTGRVFDWEAAAAFKLQHPEIPLILAGGIIPENTAMALAIVRPSAIDVASGAESSPGVKDFTKVAAYLKALLP